MDELVKLVAQKTGLAEAQARTAVQTVIDFVKQRLPAPIAGQIDGIMGTPNAMKGAEDVAKNLGGLFDKK